MFPEIDEIDWKAINEVEIRKQLLSLLSSDSEVRKVASLTLLNDLIPYEVIDGCGTEKELEELISRDILILIIKPLVSLLRNKNIPAKHLILNILLEMLGYIGLENECLSESKRVWYRSYSCQIYNHVYSAKEIFNDLVSSQEPYVAKYASELLEKLEKIPNPCNSQR